MSKIKIYAKSILIPVIIGGIIGWIISGFMDYDTLNKPFLSPPGIVFPIVWTILYVLMGISYGILDSKGLVNDEIKQIYFYQLIVNALWSVIFFVFKWRFFAFLWIILLGYLVVLMIIKFCNKNKLAGWLQVPYLLWIIFAAYLNLGVSILN